MQVSNGIVPNKERGGYDLYVNGKFMGWAKYLRDIKSIQKNRPAVVIYSDDKKVRINF